MDILAIIIAILLAMTIFSIMIILREKKKDAEKIKPIANSGVLNPRPGKYVLQQKKKYVSKIQQKEYEKNKKDDELGSIDMGYVPPKGLFDGVDLFENINIPYTASVSHSIDFGNKKESDNFPEITTDIKTETMKFIEHIICYIMEYRGYNNGMTKTELSGNGRNFEITTLTNSFFNSIKNNINERPHLVNINFLHKLLQNLYHSNIMPSDSQKEALQSLALKYGSNSYLKIPKQRPY